MPALRKIYFRVTLYLSFVAITLHTCSASGASQVVADANQFPVSVRTEAFNDHPINVKVVFKIFLPKDNKRYIPVSPTLAQFMSSSPDVYAKPDLRVRVIRTECIPEDVTATVGGNEVMGKGGVIDCEIEIAPLRSVRRGVYDVILSFGMIDKTFDMLSSTVSLPKAVVHIQVETWPSPAAKQEALLAAEAERKRKEEMAAQARHQKEEAEAQARRQKEEAEAQARHEARIRMLKLVSPYLGLGLFLAIIVFLKRKWLWPDFKVRLQVGKKMQFDNVLRGRGGMEPGMILHTAWAKAWYGTRQRIKVETFAAEGLHSDSRSKLDLLVSIGTSVRPGVYLAKLPNGAIRVYVGQGSSQ